MQFGISSVCSSFNESVIGTRVLNRGDFLAALSEALQAYDASSDRVEGQHFVNLTEVNLVSSGVGRVEGHGVESFVVREHRGEVSAYLHRSHASEATGIAAVVYTLDAYMADPEVDMSEEDFGDDVSHVIVAVLAFAGPKSPLPPRRFVSNLAGGNREALEWTADEIRSLATDVNDYWSEWRVVADAAPGAPVSINP